MYFFQYDTVMYLELKTGLRETNNQRHLHLSMWNKWSH